MFEINNNDIKRLGKYIIEYLKSKINFTGYRFWHDEMHFDEIEITQRQKIRALEQIEKGEIFWDRVGNNLFIPLFDIVIVLEGAKATLDIHCQDILLRFMKDAILNKITETKRQLIYSNSSFPDYTVHTIEQILSENQNATILYLELKSQDICRGENIVKNLLLNKDIEFVGNYKNSYFYIVYNLTQLEQSRLIQKFNHVKFNKKDVNRLILYPIKNFSNIDEIKLNFNLIRNLVRLLKINFTTLDNLKTFFNMIELNILDTRLLLNFTSSLLRLEEIVKNIKTDFILGTYINSTNLEVENIDFELNLLELINIKIRKNSYNEKESDFRDKFYKDTIKLIKENTISGFKYYKNDDKDNVFIELICTLIHSKLLGAGNYVRFDHITYNVIGDEYITIGDYKRAMEAYNKSIELCKENLTALNSLGSLLAEMGNKKKGESILKKGISIDPNDINLLYNLAGICITSNRFNEAKEYMKKAYELNRNDIVIASRYAQVLEKLGEHDKALEILTPFFDSAQETLPVFVYKLMAKLLLQSNNNWKKAKELLNIAMRLNPNDKESHVILSYGYLVKENDPETASRILQKVSLKEISGKDIKSLYTKIQKQILATKLKKT